LPLKIFAVSGKPRNKKSRGSRADMVNYLQRTGFCNPVATS